MKNTKKGFTLVELLVVIAILAILASVAVVGYTSFLDKAKDSNAQTEAHQLETAIEAVIMIPGDHYVLGTKSIPASGTVGGEDYVPASTETYYIVKNNGAVVVTKDLATLAAVTTLPEGFDFNEDIDALGGKLTYNGAGVFGFESKSGGKATIDLTK